MKQKIIINLFLVIVFIIGSFLRIVNIQKSPPSLNWDEAALGYNAYSIMKTQKDEYGVRFPIFTRSYDEYKSTLPLYLMIPTIEYFGLNEFSVRLPSAIIGSLSILAIYFLALVVSKNKLISLIAATVFSFSPWAVHLSRVYQEGYIAFFLLLVAILFFVASQKKNILLPFSILSFMLSMYTYNSNKILSPLILFVLFFVYRKSVFKYKKITLFSSGIIFVLSVSLFIYLAFIGQSFARVLPTNIFVLWTGVDNSVIELLLSNPFYSFLWEIVGRYAAYFSPANIFVRTPLEPSTVVPGTSIFEPQYFVFWLVGLFYIFGNIKKYNLLIILALLSPLPAVVTWNWFQPGRTLLLFSVYSIIIAMGIYETFKWIGTKTFKSIKMFLYIGFMVFVMFSAVYVFDAVNTQLPLRVAGNWQPGFSETVPLVMDLEQQYEKIVIDTNHAQPYIFYLFYGKYDPVRYHGELDLDMIGTPRKSFDFGKFEFREINWETDKNEEGTLFVGDSSAFPNNLGVPVAYRKEVTLKDGFTKNVIIGIR
jgi:4-amino-4-deoxy-L-arabinose transferase-like glycosyltransferase